MTFGEALPIGKWLQHIASLFLFFKENLKNTLKKNIEIQRCVRKYKIRINVIFIPTFRFKSCPLISWKNNNSTNFSEFIGVYVKI